MQNKNIRKAIPADTNALIVLLNELFTQDIEFEPDYSKQKAGLEKILDNSGIGDILVLTDNNKIIGMVSILYSISTALGGKVGLLEDMIIDKNYRGKGLGTQLLNAAIEYSRENGCLRLTLLTDFNNETAIKFYKQSGFNKSEMIPMRLIF